MNNSNHNTQRPELQGDIIELGVASVQTKGEAGVEEGLGIDMAAGISDE